MKAEANCNIALALQDAAARLPDETALVTGKRQVYRSWTFGQLQQQSERFAAALQRAGVVRGQRVMLMVRPSMEFICLTFALFRMGAVVILIDPGMGYRNLRRCIGSVRPDVLVGIPAAQIFSRLFPAPFRTVRTRVCVGRSFGVLGKSLQELCREGTGGAPLFAAEQNDLAAIIFTTGSTGPPKGVQYTHGIFHAQLELIRDYYGIGPGQVDQPGFPLFALFSTALGARAVIPDMDPSRPAQVDPARFISSIIDHQVTYSFGSPAIWNVVSRYCLEHKIVLPVQKILMAGAPVPGELIERVAKIMDPDGDIHTPYGATECLPIVSMRGSEILAETWAMTRQGKGTCVGRPLPGIDIRIIRAVNGVIQTWDDAVELPCFETGEIVARGPVVTRAYDNNPGENALAKIEDGHSFWHRMGDMGYLDDTGRLWFCGRKAHRVVTAEGVMYTIPCEAIFNEHPAVRRSALVGVGKEGEQIPVLIAELAEGHKPAGRIVEELQQLAASNVLTRSISTFLFHPSFPVDIRHNAKIFREKLARWAGDQLHEQENG